MSPRYETVVIPRGSRSYRLAGTYRLVNGTWKREISVDLDDMKYSPSIAQAIELLQKAAQKVDQGTQATLSIEVEDSYGDSSLVVTVLGTRDATEEEISAVLAEKERLAYLQRDRDLAAERQKDEEIKAFLAKVGPERAAQLAKEAQDSRENS